MTKEEQIKILDEIQKTVKKYDSNSSLGVSFEGFFEMARDNIERDFKFNVEYFKNYYKFFNRKVGELILELKEELKEKDEIIQKLNESEKHLKELTRILTYKNEKNIKVVVNINERHIDSYIENLE